MLLLLFAGVFVATIFAPGPMVALVVVNTVFVLVISTLQIGIMLLPSYKPRRKELSGEPRVAILVPAYNEPPALLMETLDALAQQDYGAYDVFVIDNNTKQSAIWKPVREFCVSLGERFHFYHVDTLSGFKAGALNYVLKRLDSSYEYVAIIDADYLVSADFLRTAMSYFVDPAVALVQFPQEYRNAMAHNQPIADEYNHFFKIYMNMANHLDCVPSTGTVSVYALPALRAINGFSSDTLTEDADAGLRLYAAGYRGVYVEQTVGRGLMPYDLASYRKQKRRWALGNAQSLKRLFLLSGKISWRTWFGFFTHLTAWDHLNFLPFAVLAGYAFVITPLVPTGELHFRLLDVASASIFLMLFARFATFLAAFWREKNGMLRAARAFTVHIGMTFLYSEAMFEMLFMRPAIFERTNKFVRKESPTFLKSAWKEVLLGMWFAIAAIDAVIFDARPITFFAFAASALALLSVLYVQWRLFPTKWYSTRTLAAAERLYRHFLTNVRSMSL